MKQRPSPAASTLFLCLEGNFLEPLDPLEGISGHGKGGVRPILPQFGRNQREKLPPSRLRGLIESTGFMGEGVFVSEEPGSDAKAHETLRAGAASEHRTWGKGRFGGTERDQVEDTSGSFHVEGREWNVQEPLLSLCGGGWGRGQQTPNSQKSPQPLTNRTN